MNALLKKIQKDLQKSAEPEYKKSQQWFFKEGVKLYGVRIGAVRKFARIYYRQIADTSKKNIFALCNELLATHLQENSVIAYEWVARIQNTLEEKDFAVFEKWVKNYVSNWAQCDDVCTGPLGNLIARYPALIQKTIPWQKSKNRWVRRASAVSLIVPIKRSNILPSVYATVDALMRDEDDLVRKGYGWLLKEASNIYPEEIFAYVMQHKDAMPRVALRYAIEKLPASKKKQAMKR